MRYSGCNLCGGNRFSNIRAYPGFKDTDLVSCEGCGLMQAQPIPSDAFLEAYYGSSFGNASGKGFEMPDSSEKGFRRRATLQFDFIQKNKRLPHGGGRILDVGCHAASFLALFKARGWEVVGLDPNPRSVYGQKWYGIPVVQKLFSKGMFDAQSFDAILHSHALEHVPDPKATLAEFYRILKPGGWVFLEVPNESLERVSTQKVIPHLYFFTPETLGRLCEAAGFKVVSTKVLGVARCAAPIFSAKGLDWIRFRSQARYDARGRLNLFTMLPFFGRIFKEDRYFKAHPPKGEMLRVLLEKPR